MPPLGTPAPPLRPADAVTGPMVDAAEAARGKKGLLVAFTCKHGPFVAHPPQYQIAMSLPSRSRTTG